MTAEFFPEQTIRYRTFIKRTLVDGLTKVFSGHPDELLQRTKARIEFPKTEADYPCVVVRFFERSVFNAGVGHEETVLFAGESDSIEVSATLTKYGAVQLSWPPIANAASYQVFRGTTSDQENISFPLDTNSFVDTGQGGVNEVIPNIVSATLDTPQPKAVVAPSGGLSPGTYYYRVIAIEPTQAIRFRHYFYEADLEFAIYALSAYDRDLVADTLVQTITMGVLEAYTNQFFEGIYPSSTVVADAQLHFININSDVIQGFGDNQTETPWGAEDDLMYSTSYRVGVFGELYSLPPKLTYAVVERVFVYPYVAGLQPTPTGPPGDTAPWISNTTD